jgi:putative ABC transport system permease protein
MAKQFYPNEAALGRRLYIFGRPEAREIIGIAKTIKYNNVGEPERAHMYVPLDQSYASQVIVQARTSGDPDALLGTVRRELQQLDPSMPLLNVNTYRTVLRTSLWAPRFGTSLLAVFGMLALLLAAVGLYGVMSYGVSQRTREIGIRMALGARDRDVRGMVVRQGLLLATGGIVIGLLASFALARFVTSLLFDVAGADPVTFGAVAVVLMVVATLATYIPAWKASRVDPVDALRI